MHILRSVNITTHLDAVPATLETTVVGIGSIFLRKIPFAEIMSRSQFVLIIAYIVSTTRNTYSHQEIETQHWNEDKQDDVITTRGTYYNQNSNLPFVKCPAGTFQGAHKFTREGKRYFEFQSIPYAEPPKRFEPAVPKAPIEGVYDATTEPPICPQVPLDQTEFAGQEDCLYLSVSKPDESNCRREMSNGKLLPVLFWVHPGAFEHGNGSFYKGTYLLDECIVLVTINYRLGAFGFMTTGDNVIPGNLGLKDQVLALKWTRRNIQYFLGDPKQVTIAGSSAGGSSVTHHICSPASSGLFSRGIAMSLAILTPTSITEKPRKYAKALVNKFNCSYTSSEGIKTCLLRQSAEDIVLNSLAVARTHFTPVIEPQNAINTFQTAVPYQLLTTGKINRVPLLAGFVQDEGIFVGERILSNPLPVITHLDDEQYIFPKFKFWLSGTEQFEFSKDMIELWTNFMRSGKPYGRATEKIPWEMTNFWEPVHACSHHCVYDVCCASIGNRSTFSHEGIKLQWVEETDEAVSSSRNINHLNSIAPIVKCPAGTFRGSLRYTRGGKRYFEFQSIPYAEPPKRFELAIQKAPIEGEYDATTEPPICPQVPLDQTEFAGQEDCLYLSVSKPDESVNFCFNLVKKNRCLKPGKVFCKK
ncbi:unnamed protein product [Allacma fusca]|uniref:Carboxylesterase type B domain-containing protein n=1 Tax=Allacma fusca TaxID=39272 RepID=A0A8J2PF35_9HEXA|nr:unnamed protein product [Allacma fusca]